MRRLPLRLSQMSAAIAVVVSPFAAHAQFAYSPPPLRDTSSSPYYLSVSQALSHDSNVFRDPDNSGLVTSDNIWTTGVRLGLDQPISRQRVMADLNMRYNKYSNQSQLDNTAYTLNLRGEFATINNISGDIHYTRDSQLAPFQDSRTVTRITTRNTVTVDDFGLRVQYGARSRWILEGQGGYVTQRYSSDVYRFSEANEGTIGATVRYNPSDLVSFGVGVRGTHGELPNYQLANSTQIGDSYNRQDLDFLARYQVSGFTTINGRLSATHTKHTVATERNYSGLTGEVGASYKPGGRLTLNANFNRSTNDAASLYSQTLTSGSTTTTTVNRLQDTRTVNALRLQALYDATAKIQLNTVLRYEQRNLSNALIVDQLGNVTGSQSGSDHTVGFAIGAQYTITRAWSAACSIGRDRRSTGLANSVVTYNYGVTTASCSAQLALR